MESENWSKKKGNECYNEHEPTDLTLLRLR